MDLRVRLSHDSGVPLYRQLYEQLASRIRSGELAPGERLPATRELAGLLGLNRATISTAYEMLGADHLISGQVGRGSFVTGAAPETRSPWEHSAEQAEPGQPGKRRAGWQQAGSWRVEGPPQAGSQPQTGEISFVDVAARPRPVSAGRFSRQLRGRAGAAGSGGHPATRIAQRLRASAPPSCWRRRAASSSATAGRRPAHHQRLPAGARPDRPRAAAARRHGGGGRPGLPRAEEPADGDGRAAGGHSGGRGWHGPGAPGARAGAPGGAGRASWW